jgi:hypothetical protein
LECVGKGRKWESQEVKKSGQEARGGKSEGKVRTPIIFLARKDMGVFAFLARKDMGVFAFLYRAMAVRDLPGPCSSLFVLLICWSLNLLYFIFFLAFAELTTMLNAL